MGLLVYLFRADLVSDSVGTTAQTLVRAASSCFEVYDPAIEILPRVESCNSMVEDLEAHLAKHSELGRIPFRVSRATGDVDNRGIGHRIP